MKSKFTSEGIPYEIDETKMNPDTSKLGFFDELECECWDLIRNYAEVFGIILPEDDIDFRIAKGIQEVVLKYIEELKEEGE